jgi:hypothetical protein
LRELISNVSGPLAKLRHLPFRKQILHLRLIRQLSLHALLQWKSRSRP